MADVVTLVVKITSDTKSAVAGVNKVTDAASKSRAKLSAAAKVGGAVLLGLGAAAIAAGNAAAEDAQSQALLATALKNSAGASSSAIAATEDWIAAQSAATGVADDQLRPALSTLVRSTGDVASAQDALGTALDVSAATGKDVESVSSAIAKGYAGQTTAIGRLVPGLSKAVLASGDMSKVMDELAKKTGGSAAAAADTAAGKMQRMRVAMAEAQESMGSALLPILSKVATALDKVATFAQKHTTAFQIMVGVIAAIAAALVIMNAVMAVTAALEAAVLWPVLLIIVAIAALIVVVVLIVKHWDDLGRAAKAVANALQAAWNAIVGATKTAAHAIVTALKTAASAVSGAFKAAWNAIRSGVNAVANFFKQTWNVAVNVVKAYIKTYAVVFKAVMSGVKAIASAVASFFRSVWQKGISAVSASIRVWRTVIAGVIAAVRDAIGRLGAAFNNVQQTITGAFTGAVTWLVGVGEDIIRGLITGLGNMIGALASKVAEAANAIPGWFRDHLGSHSPAKKLMPVGADVIRGLIVGMTSTTDDIDTAAKTIAERMTNAIANNFAKQQKKLEKAVDKAKTKAQKKRAEKQLRKFNAHLKTITDAATSSLKAQYDVMRANASARAANAASLDTETGKLQDATDARNDYSASLRDNARDYAAVTGIEVTRRTTWETMAATMKRRVEAVQQFRQVLQDLRASGLAEDIIQQLAQAGVEGGMAQAQAIATGGPAAVAAFNDLQSTLDVAATGLGEDTASAMYDAGIAAHQALVNGLLADKAALEAAAEQLARDLQDAIDKALKKATKGGGGKKGGGKSSRVVVPITSAASYAAPSVAARGTTTTGTGQVVNINVSGAIDPEGTARQIRRILAGHDRRVGLRT